MTHDLFAPFFLALSGAVAGFIDSIAGGGGLISLPALSVIFGPGAHAIGTNKIVGTSASLVALLVYSKKGHFRKGPSIAMSIWISLGSVFGSLTTFDLREETIRRLLLVACPLIIWILFNKKVWTRSSAHSDTHLNKGWSYFFRDPRYILPGLACGYYDGLLGPGGGTFMFLALVLFARLPLLVALASSKLVNTVSAGTALITYAIGGYVHWSEGVITAVGVSLGAYLGAHFASTRAERMVRPVLVLVVGLFLARIFLQ